MIKDILIKLKDINSQKLELIDKYNKYSYLLFNKVGQENIEKYQLNIKTRDISNLENIINNKNEIIEYYIKSL